jgi:hypothetical protein
MRSTGMHKPARQMKIELDKGLESPCNDFVTIVKGLQYANEVVQVLKELTLLVSNSKFKVPPFPPWDYT